MTKSDKCACGFEAAEFSSALSSIENRIGEMRVYENKLAPNLVDIYQKVAGHALEHLHGIRDECSIDTTKEEKLLIQLQTDLSQINNSEKRNELADKTSSIIIGIREKLYGCKYGQK